MIASPRYPPPVGHGKNAPPMLLADVALPVPLAQAFSYEVPAALITAAVPGARVICAFGARRLIGVILGTREGDAPPGVRPLAQVVDDEPSLTPDLLAFLRDLSSYYLAPIGEVARLALPPVERATASALREPELFPEDTGVGARAVLWVSATSKVGDDESKLRGHAAALLAHLRAVGALPLARLVEQWGTARAVVKRLGRSGLVAVETREKDADPFFREALERDRPPEATGPQQSACTAIEAALSEGRAETFLLHGVTGSGKTEVYLRAIHACVGRKSGAIVLVPEIALTPQLVARYRARFGDDVAVLHSALTPKERLGMWKRLRSGAVNVVIGARSAIFAPVKDLALVIVDEEHDPSFKQEEGVRYHARDMAILRARRASGVCVLGSATPSLESEYLTRTGRATKLILPQRARAQAMPAVEIIDLRRIGAGPTGDKRLSLPLHRAIEATLAAKEQTILFLNRRGFAPSIRCEACGAMSECPNCSVALTFHKRRGSVLRCHYCDYEAVMLVACEACGANALVLEGLGTEKLEEVLGSAFPEARVARLDRDVASGRAIETVLARVRAREVDILVGTQMVTKGHDLPFVTLVGVINADAALSIPDFRATERAFQLLVQVAGRAGRGDVRGKVLVQTYAPDHAAIRYGVRHDVPAFLDEELANRRELVYPPYSRMALVRIDAIDESEAQAAAQTLAKVAREAAQRSDGASVEVHGPAPAPIARLRNRFRFRVVLRSTDRARLRATLLAVDRARAALPRLVRSSIDVDPVQLL